QAGLAVTAQVSGKSDAWTKIGFVARFVAGLRQSRIHKKRIRKLLVVPTQSEVKCDSRTNAPVVLTKEGPIDSTKLKARWSESLLVVARVALSGDARAGRADATSRCQGARRGEVHVVNDEVVDV